MKSTDKQALLDRYVDLVLAKNADMNLTGAHNREDLVRRHVDDALKLLDVPEFLAAHRVLDLGTGAGLPGIPLAIMRPDLEVVLLDATRKKVEAVSGFIEALSLSNARVAWGRAEVLAGESDWRRTFDMTVARAVAPLRQLLELSVPFCRSGGHVAAFKGPSADKELFDARGAIEVLHCPLVRRRTYALNDTTFHILVFQAPRTLPRRFPRDWKTIKTHPL